MKKFVKKPVVIEAIQWDGYLTTIEEVNLPICTQELGSKDLIIQLPDGDVTVNPGDWIIKGAGGEVYPVKPDIFESVYELLG